MHNLWGIYKAFWESFFFGKKRMHKRRTNKISILIVPEDNTEPYSFRVSTKWIKGLYLIGVLLIFHIILGAIFYWKYFKEYSYNKQLIMTNAELKKDNKRILNLAEQFYALEEQYKKVRNLLGIENDIAPKIGGRVKTNESTLQFDKIMSFHNLGRDSKLNGYETGRRVFLSPKKSNIHNYNKNIPTLLPVEGFLTSDFIKEGWFLPKTHAGIDIAAKKGSVIRAAGAGVIIFANWTFDLGNLIIIDHGGGILSYYGHTQRILKGEKSYVRKGEPIALLGSSGRSSGPHLHFEIWKDGSPVDPKEYILAFNENISNNH